MTNRVLGQNRYGFWIVAAVLVACLACWTDRTDAAINQRAYSASTAVEGQVWEYQLVTGWWGFMTMGPAVLTVPPTAMTPINVLVTLMPGMTMSMYIRHEHEFTPLVGSLMAQGNARDSVFWAGTSWWDLSTVEY